MEELVEKAKNGDKKAFTELMLQIKDELYKIAKTRLKKDDDVFDAIQETMIIAFKTLKKLKQNSCFKSWLIKILINKSNDIYKKENKKNVIYLEDIENNITNSSLDIENIELVLDFNFICKHLKYEERIIMTLFYMEKFTDKEIGKILELKENTVKTKRTRAIKEIKKILEKGEKKYG